MAGAGERACNPLVVIFSTAIRPTPSPNPNTPVFGPGSACLACLARERLARQRLPVSTLLLQLKMQETEIMRALKSRGFFLATNAVSSANLHTLASGTFLIPPTNFSNMSSQTLDPPTRSTRTHLELNQKNFREGLPILTEIVSSVASLGGLYAPANKLVRDPSVLRASFQATGQHTHADWKRTRMVYSILIPLWVRKLTWCGNGDAPDCEETISLTPGDVLIFDAAAWHRGHSTGTWAEELPALASAFGGDKVLRRLDIEAALRAACSWPKETAAFVCDELFGRGGNTDQGYSYTEFAAVFEARGALDAIHVYFGFGCPAKGHMNTHLFYPGCAPAPCTPDYLDRVGDLVQCKSMRLAELKIHRLLETVVKRVVDKTTRRANETIRRCRRVVGMPPSKRARPGSE